MKIFLLYPRLATPTVRAIRRAFRARGIDARRTKRVSDVLKLTAGDMVIRWGKSAQPDLDDWCYDNGIQVVNPARSIINVQDKFSTWEKLSDHGLMSGEYGKVSYNMVDAQYNDRIVMNRWSYGSRGLRKPGDTCVAYSDCWRDAFVFKYEFRCLAHERRSVRLGIKVNRQPEKNYCLHDRYQIRSKKYGWTILPLTEERMEAYQIADGTRRQLRTMAFNMCDALNMNFAACDIGVTSAGVLHAIEINSAPGLNQAGADRIVDSFIRHYDLGPGRPEHEASDDHERESNIWRDVPDNELATSPSS